MLELKSNPLVSVATGIVRNGNETGTLKMRDMKLRDMKMRETR